jgi:hypothetical protein
MLVAAFVHQLEAVSHSAKAPGLFVYVLQYTVYVDMLEL